MDEQPFFVVWNPSGGNPRYRHTTERLARHEAIRLARENPGQSFFVLEAKSVSKSVEPVTTVVFDEIPF